VKRQEGKSEARGRAKGSQEFGFEMLFFAMLKPKKKSMMMSMKKEEASAVSRVGDAQKREERVRYKKERAGERRNDDKKREKGKRGRSRRWKNRPINSMANKRQGMLSTDVDQSIGSIYLRKQQKARKMVQGRQKRV
jgi:hypothetical protein